MNALSRKALSVYSQSDVVADVDGASPHKLILLLYDGAIQAIAKAKYAMVNKDIASKCKAITHAHNIIQDGLQLSLDTKTGGDMAENLNALYDYMCDRLLIANLKNDIDALDEVGRLLAELRQAWAAIGHSQSKIQIQQDVNASPTEARAVSLSYGAA